MRSMKTMVALTLAVAAAGCDAATAPEEEQAELRVMVEGDGESARTSVSPRGASLYREGPSARTEGEVEVRARVYVRSNAGSWIELTRGAAEQTVAVSGGAEARVLATARVPSGTYHQVRVEFERVHARGDAWLELGLAPLEGTVRVDLGGDGEAAVERTVTLEAGAGSTRELRIDLNAGEWISRMDATSGAVAEAEFESAVAVSVR